MCGNILFHSPLASSCGIHRKLWGQSKEKPSDRVNKNPAKHVNFKIPEERALKFTPSRLTPKKDSQTRPSQEEEETQVIIMAISREIHNNDPINELNYRLTMIHSIHHTVNIKNQGEKLVESFKIPERNQN
jgi:hypothetical protein